MGTIKSRLLVALTWMALGHGSVRAQTMAPASVSNYVLYFITTPGPAISGTIWLKADGTFAFLSDAQSDFPVGAPLPPNGTYTYTVNSVDPSEATLQLAGGYPAGGPNLLIFTSPTGGFLDPTAGR